MDAIHDLDKNYLRMMLISFTIAVLIIFGGGFIFVKAMRGVSQSANAAVEEAEEAEEAKEAAQMPLPGDIPMYKGGVISKGSETASGRVYEIIFSLGSIAEVKAFYKEEMIKAGWHEYASGERISAYDKENGRRKTSLDFSYYAGKVKLRIYQPGS
jgi:Na+-transporting methylmalonyl-CoA/oxaloacetate decarboxylase gamma subunit